MVDVKSERVMEIQESLKVNELENCVWIKIEDGNVII